MTRAKCWLVAWLTDWLIDIFLEKSVLLSLFNCDEQLYILVCLYVQMYVCLYESNIVRNVGIDFNNPSTLESGIVGGVE